MPHFNSCVGGTFWRVVTNKWSRNLDKLMVIYLVKKSPGFMWTEMSSPCLQEPITGPYLEPVRSVRNLLLCFFTVVISSYASLRFPCGFTASSSPTNFVHISHLPTPCIATWLWMCSQICIQKHRRFYGISFCGSVSPLYWYFIKLIRSMPESDYKSYSSMYSFVAQRVKYLDL
jgi:hypothetical protein